MGIFRKSTPRKSESKIVPDEKDGTIPYIEESKHEDALFASQSPEEEVESTELGEDNEGQLALDVFQTEDEIVVVAPVAGVKKENLSISINRTDDRDEVLTIKGRRDFQFKAGTADYFTQECFWGSFSRSVILPDYVDTSAIKASFKNGIATIRIPKTENIKMRNITIKEE